MYGIYGRMEYTVYFWGYTICFQSVSWLAFLGAFDMKLWLLIAVTIPVCGFLYGLASYIVQEIIFPSQQSPKLSFLHHIKTTGLFTFAAYFAQGRSILISLMEGHDKKTIWFSRESYFVLYRSLLWNTTDLYDCREGIHISMWHLRSLITEAINFWKEKRNTYAVVGILILFQLEFDNMVI